MLVVSARSNHCFFFFIVVGIVRIHIGCFLFKSCLCDSNVKRKLIGSSYQLAFRVGSVRFCSLVSVTGVLVRVVRPFSLTLQQFSDKLSFFFNDTSETTML